MIVFELPDDYQKQTERIIQEQQEEGASRIYEIGWLIFLMPINEYLKEHNIAQISPGQVKVHETLNDWLINLPDKREEARIWSYIMMQSGPSIGSHCGEYDVHLVLSDKEYIGYDNDKPPIDQVIPIKIVKEELTQ